MLWVVKLIQTGRDMMYAGNSPVIDWLVPEGSILDEYREKITYRLRIEE
jgi:hypothetical protein